MKTSLCLFPMQKRETALVSYYPAALFKFKLKKIFFLPYFSATKLLLVENSVKKKLLKMLHLLFILSKYGFFFFMD